MRTLRPARLVSAASGALALTATMTAPVAADDVPAHSDLLPEFTYSDLPVPDPDWDPTGERIFPSVVRAADYLEDPLGEYYLYYAPHERPGGIAMAYSDDLDGPWTEYADNPLVSNVWQPHFDVSHVSSPHVIWNEDEEQFFLFFHGENDITRFATSTDGAEWTYGGAAVTTDAITGTESSYARVYERRVEGMDNRYVMTFMDHVGDPGFGGDRRIRWAVSDDMRTWEVQPEPLVRPNEHNRENASGAYLLDWNGRTVVVYHGSDGDMWASEVGPALDRDVPLGRVHTALDTAPDNGRSAAPSFYVEGGEFHVFYEAGSRLSADIGHAKGTLRPTDDVSRDLVCSATPATIQAPNRPALVPVHVDVDLPNATLGPYGFTLTDIDAHPRDAVGFRTGTPDTDGWIYLRPSGPRDRTVTLTYTGHDEIGRPASCETTIRIDVS